MRTLKNENIPKWHTKLHSHSLTQEKCIVVSGILKYTQQQYVENHIFRARISIFVYVASHAPIQCTFSHWLRQFVEFPDLLALISLWNRPGTAWCFDWFTALNYNYKCLRFISILMSMYCSNIKAQLERSNKLIAIKSCCFTFLTTEQQHTNLNLERLTVCTICRTFLNTWESLLLLFALLLFILNDSSCCCSTAYALDTVS